MAVDIDLEAEWIAEIGMDDLPPMYKEVAEIIGVAAAVKLSRHLGGLQTYYIKLDGILEKVRNKMIRRDRNNGMEYRELVKKYRLSEVWIRQIVDHQADEERQQDMFA